jgi:hypothetical protein
MTSTADLEPQPAARPRGAGRLLDALTRRVGVWLTVFWILLLANSQPLLFLSGVLGFGIGEGPSVHRLTPVLIALVTSVRATLIAVAGGLLLATVLVLLRKRKVAAIALAATPSLVLVVPILAVIAAGGLGPEIFVRYVGDQRHLVPWEYHTYGAEAPRPCSGFAVRVRMPDLAPGFSVDGPTKRVSFGDASPGCKPYGSLEPNLDAELARWRSNLGRTEETSAYGLTLLRSADVESGAGNLARHSLLYERDPLTGRVIRLINCSGPDPVSARRCEHEVPHEGILYDFGYPGSHLPLWADIERRVIELRRSFAVGRK